MKDIPTDIPFDSIHKIQLIGKGTFGKVFKVKYEGKIYALKALSHSSGIPERQKRKFAESLKLEARTLARLGKCENIVQLVGTSSDKRGQLCILMEMVEGKNLSKFIEEEFPKHEWDLRDAITLDIAKAIKFIHALDIIHRDLKSENILIDMLDENRFRAKLADFGVSKVNDEIKGTLVGTFLGAGTPPWMPPELFDQPEALPNYKTDIYGFGMIMWEIAAERRPYEGMNKEQIRVMKQENKIEKIELFVPPFYEKLLTRCLQFNPDYRPAISEIVRLLTRSSLYKTDVCLTQIPEMADLSIDIDDLPENEASILINEKNDVNKLQAQASVSSRVIKHQRNNSMFDSDTDSDEEEIEQTLNTLLKNVFEGSVEAKSKLIEDFNVDPDDKIKLNFTLGHLYYYGEKVGQDYSKAAEYFEIAVDLGSKEALFYLGICYKLGHGRPQDHERACDLFIDSIEAGIPLAYGHLGECYFNGWGVVQNIEKALSLFQSGATHLDSHSQYYLGKMYLGGIGLAINYPKAIKYFAAAARDGHAEAQYNIGLIHKRGQGTAPDDNEAFRWFFKSAEQGNPGAQNNVGYCYYIGSGVTQDYFRAAKWFRASAQQGNLSAQVNLAECYELEHGLKQDFKQVVFWLTKAAEGGNATAQKNLGVCCLKGTGVEKNAVTAFQWFMRSARLNHSQGQLHLANCYKDGTGTAKDPARSFYWYLLSAEAKNPEAQLQVALCFQKGIGTNLDVNMAFRWLRMSADSGNATAQFYLGRCYIKGTGVTVSEPKGVYWFRKAVESDHPEALNGLGACYYEGKGVAIDYKESFKLFEHSAKLGSPSGMYNVADAYLKGHGPDKDILKALRYFKASGDRGFIQSYYVLGQIYEKGEHNQNSPDLERALKYYRLAATKIPKAQRQIDYIKSRVTGKSTQYSSELSTNSNGRDNKTWRANEPNSSTSPTFTSPTSPVKFSSQASWSKPHHKNTSSISTVAQHTPPTRANTFPNLTNQALSNQMIENTPNYSGNNSSKDASGGGGCCTIL